MIASIAMLVAIFLPIPAIIKSMNERITPFRAVMNGMLYGIVGALAVMVIGQIMGINAFDELFNAVDAAMKQIAENPQVTAQLEAQTGAESVSMDQLLETLGVVYETSIKLLPGCLCVLSLCASYFEYIILSKVLKPGGLTPIPMTKMQEFDLPRRLITVWCLIYIVALIMANTEAFGDSIIFLNLSMLFDFAFCLQGLSVVFMFCHTKRIPRAIPAIFMVLVLLLGVLKNIVMLLGFVDLIFGLKYRMKQKF